MSVSEWFLFPNNAERPHSTDCRLQLPITSNQYLPKSMTATEAATKPQICGLYTMQVVVHAAHFTIVILSMSARNVFGTTQGFTASHASSRSNQANVSWQPRSQLNSPSLLLLANSVASFPGSPLVSTKNRNRGGEPGIDSHVIPWHDDVTAIIA